MMPSFRVFPSFASRILIENLHALLVEVVAEIGVRDYGCPPEEPDYVLRCFKDAFDRRPVRGPEQGRLTMDSRAIRVGYLECQVTTLLGFEEMSQGYPYLGVSPYSSSNNCLAFEDFFSDALEMATAKSLVLEEEGEVRTFIHIEHFDAIDGCNRPAILSELLEHLASILRLEAPAVYVHGPQLEGKSTDAAIQEEIRACRSLLWGDAGPSRHSLRIAPLGEVHRGWLVGVIGASETGFPPNCDGYSYGIDFRLNYLKSLG